MTITELRYFEAVCIYKRISVAAEYLHISQPSLSVAIKGLEAEFGVTLFERRHRGVSLTAEGERLYEMSRELLSRYDEVCRVMHDLGNKRTHIKIGVPPMIGSLILPRIYGEFIAAHPDISLDIEEGGSRALAAKLKDGELDFVFLTHDEDLDSDISATEVARLDVVCCVAKGDRLSELRAVSPSDLEGRPLVLFRNSFFQTEIIKKLFLKAGVRANIALQTDQLSTAKSMVESGVAVGFLFKELIKNSTRVDTIPLSEDISVRISLARRRGAYLTESMKALQAFLKEIKEAM